MKRENFIKHARSPEETIETGRQLAKILQPGDIVLLQGDLGAGKTHFTKGIVDEIAGNGNEVNSPTFALVNEYRDNEPNIFHFDCYRIENPMEIIQVGWQEYINEDGICIVEWPEKIREFIPEYAVEVNILHKGETEREIQIFFHDS